MLFEEQPKRKNRQTVEGLLRPLREGRTVILTVNDPRLPKKERLKHAPLLFLAPLSLYGGPTDKLLASFQTRGCEVIDIPDGLRAMSFIRMGINAFLAAALADKLRELYGGKHGASTGSKGSRKARSTNRSKSNRTRRKR